MEQEQEEQSETPVAELLDIAQNKTRRLTPRERRSVIRYVEEHGVKDAATGVSKPLSNYQLADLFSVDEKIIRIDKRKLLKDYTKLITPEDAMVYVGTFMQGHDDLLRRAIKALDDMPHGTLAHAKYLQITSDLHKRRVQMLQEIGALPKELGNLNVNEELWEAVIQDDGNGNATTGVRRVPANALPLEKEDNDLAQPDDDEVMEAEIVGE